MSQINLFGFLGQKDSSTKKYKYKVKSILDNIIYSFNFILKKYSINVQTDIKGKVHTPLMFEQELYTIVINVLSNAIKAVLASEGVDILIQAEETKEGFRLAVYDGGVGLSGEFKEKVFMPLEVDPDNKIYPALKGLKDGDLFSFGQGTGLGLSIVKDIVEGYNGEIKFVNPEKPWVTCVEVFLPW